MLSKKPLVKNLLLILLIGIIGIAFTGMSYAQNIAVPYGGMNAPEVVTAIPTLISAQQPNCDPCKLIIEVEKILKSLQAMCKYGPTQQTCIEPDTMDCYEPKTLDCYPPDTIACPQPDTLDCYQPDTLDCYVEQLPDTKTPDPECIVVAAPDTKTDPKCKLVPATTSGGLFCPIPDTNAGLSCQRICPLTDRIVVNPDTIFTRPPAWQFETPVLY